MHCSRDNKNGQKAFPPDQEHVIQGAQLETTEDRQPGTLRCGALSTGELRLTEIFCAVI